MEWKDGMPCLHWEIKIVQLMIQITFVNPLRVQYSLSPSGSAEHYMSAHWTALSLQRPSHNVYLTWTMLWLVVQNMCMVTYHRPSHCDRGIHCCYPKSCIAYQLVFLNYVLKLLSVVIKELHLVLHNVMCTQQGLAATHIQLQWN